jgi:hypothetical protein
MTYKNPPLFYAFKFYMTHEEIVKLIALFIVNAPEFPCVEQLINITDIITVLLLKYK